MSTVLEFDTGSPTTLGNTVTLHVDAQGFWRASSTATRHVTSVTSTLANGESFALTLTKVSSTIPGLSYSLSGTSVAGQTQSNGDFKVSLPQPSAAQSIGFTAVPNTPAPAPTGLTVTIRRQSAGLRAAHVEDVTSR
ncbi:MAG: hypothetical protein IAG13_35570 [Deltaproteobacteria bacterium]|nr:hypothetical protein [Nannocystaceae bacterium]